MTKSRLLLIASNLAVWAATAVAADQSRLMRNDTVDVYFIIYNGHLALTVSQDPIPASGAYHGADHVSFHATDPGCHPSVHVYDDGTGDPFQDPPCPNASDRCELTIPHKPEFSGERTYKYTVRVDCDDNRRGVDDPEVVVAGEGREAGHAHAIRVTLDRNAKRLSPSPATVFNGSLVEWSVGEGRTTIEFVKPDARVPANRYPFPPNPECARGKCQMKIDNLAIGRYYPYTVTVDAAGRKLTAYAVLVVMPAGRPSNAR